MLKFLLALLSLAIGALWSAEAGAHSMCSSPSASVSGSTNLQFTVDLGELDVEASPTGAAMLGAGGAIVLPVTGGDFQSSPVSGSLEHAGSGIDFVFDAVTVSLEDLEFDFDDQIVNADLSAGPLHVSTGVFNILPCVGGGCTGATDPANQYGLFLRAQAADFFENVVFGDNGGFDDGDQIALATLGAAQVPEPGVLLLIAGAIGALSCLRRRSHLLG